MIPAKKKFKDELSRIVFDSATPMGKLFDIILVIAIVFNSLLIILESVQSLNRVYAPFFTIAGWSILFLFALEYIIRVFVSPNRMKYLFSFFGIMDLLAILPLLVGIFFPFFKVLAVVRIFRLLRLFSVFKMGRYIEESGYLLQALKASRAKIIVFISTILFIVVIVGALMYIIEGPDNGYYNIPVSMYWAIVTLSTVGYGDISPQTVAGKLISSLLMIVAYGIIAVPTGIITYEIANASKKGESRKSCRNCLAEGYRIDDKYCSKCGEQL